MGPILQKVVRMHRDTVYDSAVSSDLIVVASQKGRQGYGAASRHLTLCAPWQLTGVHGTQAAYVLMGVTVPCHREKAQRAVEEQAERASAERLRKRLLLSSDYTLQERLEWASNPDDTRSLHTK